MHIKSSNIYLQKEPGGHDLPHIVDVEQEDIYDRADKESIASDSDCS
jgi:hypothetical protein